MPTSPGRIADTNVAALVTPFTGICRFAFQLLLVFILLLGATFSAQAATKFCSEFGGVIDGDVISPVPTQITIDTDCTFQNWPVSNPFTATINFQTNDPSIYLIIFDNTHFTGNMACANIDHRIWFSNSSYNNINPKCQDLFIPVESIDKQNPASQTTATIGVPFTYTLTLPDYQFIGGPSINDLHTVTLWDDLTTTGADLTYVSVNAYYLGSGTPVTLVPETNPLSKGGVWTTKNLSYEPIPIISAGEQIVVEFTVVLDNTPANVAGIQFINTAKWWFGRLIDGVFYDPLPGEWGVTPPMTIAEPDIQVTKSSTETAVNLGTVVPFTIDVQNAGGSDVWNVTILDELPKVVGPTPAGMCDFDPTATVTAEVFAADGVTTVSGLLLQGIDYSVSYNNAPQCELSLTMLTPAAVIGATERLIITYQSQLDAGTTGDGVALTNIAGAIEWFGADATVIDRREYTRALTDGTPLIADHQDSHTITTALSGYVFQKTVQNLTTGVNPTATAAPGDTLRYRLRLFNVDQTINNVTISDQLEVASFDLNTFSIVSSPAGSIVNYNSASGLLNITGDGSPLNTPVGTELVVEFDITLLAGLVNNNLVSNQATLTADNSFTATSDDPSNGIAPPDDEDPTVVLIQTPSPLSKTNTQASATIGEQFTYTITVPFVTTSTPLYDVRILDDLTTSSADMRFISASVISGGSWGLSNTGTATSFVIEDTSVGIDIPANGQAVIEVTVELLNTVDNNNGLAFNNTATFTYNRLNSTNSTQTNGISGVTADMEVTEPLLFVTKVGTLISPVLGGGSIIEYVISMRNDGSSTAYDVNLVDTLPAELALLSASDFTPTATIGGTPVAGFISGPTDAPVGPLLWGRDNADGSLDIQVGETLLLTYRAQVQNTAAGTFDNTVQVDWTSLNNTNSAERIGAGCPTPTTFDDYCATATSPSFTIVDNNELDKAIVSDSYVDAPSTALDATVRIGDTATYQLTLNLGEGTTNSVTVSDVLPTGLTLNSFTITPASGAADFNYTLVSQPAPGATGTLVWDLGDVVNSPSADGLSPVDALVIEYVVTVTPDAGIAQAPTSTLTNTATLGYLDGVGAPVVDPVRLEATADLIVWQPVMTAISKTGNTITNTVADPLNVSISTDTVQFQVASCNTTGLAPAYSMVLSDVLATQLDETSLTLPVVTVNGVILTPVTDYTYTPPIARGGTLQIELITPVNPGQCATVDYDMGFHTDFPPTQTWNNRVTVDEYWSLSASSGQRYTPITSAQFYMTNIAGPAPMSKVVTSPVSGEVTVGEDVVYTITLPITSPNFALTNVVVTDPLHPALEYLGATAVDENGLAVILDDTATAGQNVELKVPDIADGKQVIITLNTRVANNTDANAGISFTNTATYTSDDLTDPVLGISGAVRIVEPLVAIGKTVVNTTNPGAAPTPGDTLSYSLTFTANGGANFSDAFDLGIEDNLSLGLAYVNSSVSVNGAGNTITDPTVTGDGSATAQTLTWNLADATADIDIVEGTIVTVNYDALVLAGVAGGQLLSNSASAQWTGLEGINALERTGTATPVENDYFTGSVTTSLTSQAGALLKETTQATAYVGEQFTYRITMPAVAQSTDLNDVRILDDLNLSAADLTFISVSKVFGSQPWAPVNTSGDTKNLIIEDTSVGIDIPAGEQAIIDITVQLDNTVTNASGLVFNNTADYTHSVTQDPGLPDTSGDMTIIGADSMVMIKTGPATMRPGLSGSFTLDVQNTGTAPAWDLTVVDILPNPSPGGMCDDSVPTNIVAQISDGINPPVTLAAADYATTFSGVPSCVLTVTMQSVAAVIPANSRLIVTYDASLDSDNVGGTALTNRAAATEWFSQDTAGSGATGTTITYTGSLTDGTVGTPDEEDAHTVTVESPVLIFRKSVVNATTGQVPDPNPTIGLAAQPGDILRYTIYVENTSAVTLPAFSLVDELDVSFAAGSLNIVSVLPVGATNNTDPNGGSNGTGLLDISDLSLDADGGNDILQIIFEVTLATAIDNGTLVLNQASLSAYGVTLGVSDDPNINGVDDENVAGDEDPTQTLITSAPLFQLDKISTDITGDPAILDPGDTLRYTLTVKNIGDENTLNTLLSDQIPSNTTYVAGSTTLNTVAVADPSTGVSALAAGMLINAPENTTAGFMRADIDLNANNVATITFDVVINLSTSGGVVISNQGFLSGDGAGSGTFPQQPSNDPDTAAVDDPTLDVVGSVAVIDVLKTVAIENDLGAPGIVDPGDTLRYTITMTNIGTVAATGVVLTDAVPANSDYAINTSTLNGLALIDDASPDESPFIAGVDISSSDLAPPIQGAGNGMLSAGASAVVTFDVIVDGAATPGMTISNQGFVNSTGLPQEPSDADGNDANGDQPTVVVVGNEQQLAITKEVLVVGGGPAEAGGQLEYVVRVTNIGSVAANNVVINDDLDVPVAGQMTYIAGSGLLNGLPVGVSNVGSIVTADYFTAYGVLPVGGVAELRFRVLLDAALNIGDTVSNTGEVSWDAPTSTLAATADIDVGGTLGAASLSGQVWHDADFSNDVGANEALLQDWRVELYRNNVLLNSDVTDVNGSFQFSGLLPNLPAGDAYELRYFAPGAGTNTASLGTASSVFTNFPQRITNILAASGASIQNLNLPRQANGVVYDSILRVPVAGARLTMINQTRSNAEISEECFADTKQQNQITLAGGYYKFDLDFSEADCDETDEYVIQVLPPATGYIGTTSVIIPPIVPITGTAKNVPACLSDGTDEVVTTLSHCENSTSDAPAPTAVAPRAAATNYNLKFIFDSAFYTNQIYNNHIPVDSKLEAAVAISKVAGLLNVTRSQLVPYTITFTNTLGVRLFNLNIVDNFPAGFKYVEGSARVDEFANEPAVNGRQLTWSGLEVDVNESRVIKLLLVVGSGVSEGEYINTAQAFNEFTDAAVSGIAPATVRVIPDPSFDCSDIIGKVYDDANMNMYQDDGEVGLAGVQVATARGLRVTTDSNGRFHITCAVVPNEIRGSNFIIKLDERTLPSGYRVTTENPRVQRATRGKMLKFNFGAAIHRIVRLDLANGVFEKGSTELRPQWRSRIDMLIIELQKDPSILRLSYLGENETESEVDDRLDVIESLISDRWQKLNCCYKLTIEKEVFWRKGNPSDRMTFD